MKKLVKFFMVNIFIVTMLIAMFPSKSVEAAGTQNPLVSIDFAQGAGNVTLTGAEIVNDSIRGNVLKLNGTGSRTSYGTYTTDVFQNNDWTNGMTLSAWIQTSEGSNVHGTTPIYCVDMANRGYIATLCSLETTTNTNGNEGGFVEPCLWNDPADAATGTNKTTEGEWQLVTVVYDPVANNMRIYINGEYYSTNTINNGDIATLMTQITIAKSITLGSWNCSWWQHGDYKGMIDDFKLWNHALSETEIKELYQSTKAEEQGLFEMTQGGSIRIAMPYGLRFQVKMDSDVKTYVEQKSGKVGMFIFPADYLVDSGKEGDVHYKNVEELVNNAPNDHRINLDLTSKLYEKDGYWYGNGAIVNIKDKNMSREFVGIAYYEVNGVRILAHTSSVKDTTRSAAQVALLTHADKTNEFSDEADKLLVNYIDHLKLAGVEDSAPSRYKVRGFAADDGLHIYAVQYVDNVVQTGNEWNEQTHLEAQIWQHNMGYGVDHGLAVDTYCAFFLNGNYFLNNPTNTTVEYNCVIKDRGNTEEYRYEICYEIFLQFPNNVGNPEGPYAFVQFKHHMPKEEAVGFENAHKVHWEDTRYLWQDKSESTEFRLTGMVEQPMGITRYAEKIADRKSQWEEKGTDGKTTLFIGDSFFDTDFWTDFYTNYYAGKDALLLGIGGTTTYDWETWATEWLKDIQPKNIVMHMGTNNIYDDGDDAECTVLALQKMFGVIHKNVPNTPIYWFGISYRSYGEAKIAKAKEINAQMKTWCEGQEYITYIDTPDKLAADMLSDGTHPKVESYYVFADALKETNIEIEDSALPVKSDAPTRYSVSGYAANNGLYLKVKQYVNQYVTEGDVWSEQTHLEASIWQHNMGHGVANSLGVDTYCRFMLTDTDGDSNYDYDINNLTNIKNVTNHVTITERSEGYRYEICYDIFIEFDNNVGSADGPYAFVQFRHHMPGESQEGFESAYMEHRDGSRYLYRDNCNSYEFRAAGIVAKKVDYLSTTADYNKELFYQNQGTIQAADPSVITVGDTFYLYATDAQEGYDCTSIRVWSSKNLTDWIEVGQAFRPASDAWAVSDLWAAEVIAANGKYYMYYSGRNRETELMGVGVAVSDSPTGPFKNEQPIDLGFPAIDPNPFIDDAGNVYLYVSQDQVNKVSAVYGCKLASDMVTIEHISEGPLVEPSESWEYPNGNKSWNEAPYVFKHGNKYYLTYSANFYQNKDYGLGLAVSDNPLSGFEKVDYNPFFVVDDAWTHVSGTGHCSFFPSPDGTELWVAYHSHIDTEKGGYQRKINFDKVTFDNDGRLVISGPSVTPQVLPSGVSDYGNIASKATVSATQDENVGLLTDGIVNYRTANIDRYEYSSTGANTITFTFDKIQKIKGIMIYDSANTTVGGSEVSVTVGEYSYNMSLDSSDIPGTASILEMDETEASVVTLTFAGDVSLSEIAILADVQIEKPEGFPEIADFSTIASDLQSVDPDIYNFQMWTTDSGLYAYFVQIVPNVTLTEQDNFNNTHVEMELWNHCVGWGAQTGAGTYIGLFPDESIYINNETNVKSKSLCVNRVELISGETRIEYYFYLEFDNNLENPQDGPYAYVKQYQFLPGVSTNGLNSQVVERDRLLLTGTEKSFQVHATIDEKMYH
ncbi:MAG: family 43 glycosylhydrolase [Tyzzerella sp.]|nr:family 43 glycosylhydrolase [Tyzzerella sp.]